MLIREERKRMQSLIESDIILKQILLDVYTVKEDVFNRLDYYTKKYQKYSNLKRDVNLSVGFNANKSRPCVFIYVADKYFKSRIELEYSYDGREITNHSVIMKEKKRKEKNFVNVEIPVYSEQTKHYTNTQLFEMIKDSVEMTLDLKVVNLQEQGYPLDGVRNFKVFLGE